MLTYTVRRSEPQGTTKYKGINRWTAGCKYPLVIAIFDGEPDMWVIGEGEVLENIAEIVRYYEDDFQRGPESIVVYERIN